jgi:hypothetical protein
VNVGLSTKYSCAFWHETRILVLTCITSEPDNPRAPKAGDIKKFNIAPHINIDRLMKHMDSLTDDQCDSFFPQAPVKKSKKAKES